MAKWGSTSHLQFEAIATIMFFTHWGSVADFQKWTNKIKPAFHIWCQGGIAMMEIENSFFLPHWANLYHEQRFSKMRPRQPLFSQGLQMIFVISPEADKNTTKGLLHVLKRLPPCTLPCCSLTRSLSILSQAAVRLPHQLWAIMCCTDPKLCVNSFP